MGVPIFNRRPCLSPYKSTLPSPGALFIRAPQACLLNSASASAFFVALKSKNCGAMESIGSGGRGGEWWLYALPVLCGQGIDKFGCAWAACVGVICAVATIWWRSRRPGGCAWAGRGNAIPGPAGLPVLGSLVDMTAGLAHRNLAELARVHGARKLMAFSLGSTPAVITSDPDVARELLGSPHMADRPLKQSAKELMFGRAMGFARSGDYWRMLRRISAAHLFAPRTIAAHQPARQADSQAMLHAVLAESSRAGGAVALRGHLQRAALDNITGCVFGRRLGGAHEVREMVDEGFNLLGAFNWADHLPWLRPLDPLRVHARCARLVPRVRRFVHHIIRQHRADPPADSDFVDVLLSLQGADRLQDDDMVAVLWEMVFRGTDATALLAEWTMAEMVLNPEAQGKVQGELDRVVGRGRSVSEEDVGKLPYLEAVVKEALRMHPPGPLLSWARLATRDVHLAAADGACVPAGTTAMVNMWAIARDPRIWESPGEFRPERFLASRGGENIDVRGSDLRLAPFGAGRRACPGKALGLAAVHLWVAKLLHHFVWLPSPNHPVDLSEVLRLSCEMAHPLRAIPRARVPF